MASLAGLMVLDKVGSRKKTQQESPYVLGRLEGISDGRVTFLTSAGDSVSVPIKNIITNRAIQGTFVVSRPVVGAAFAFKEIR